MSEKEKKSYDSLVESIGIERDIDLPELIGDEWADPEEILYDACADCIDAEIEAMKHRNSSIF